MRTLIAVVLGITLLAGGVAFSQEEDVQGSVYAIGTWKVRFDNLEEFFRIMEEEFHPISVKNEYILTRKVMKHLWGPDWTVLVITEYKDMASIPAAEKRWKELLEEKYPDEAERDRIVKKWQSMILAHTDAIVQEMPKLTE